MHLEVFSLAPTQMPLEVQIDHWTHATQLGFDLVLCLLEECKTSITGEQYPSLGGPAANQVLSLFCPIPDVERVPWPLACVAKVYGGHSTHRS